MVGILRGVKFIISFNILIFIFFSYTSYLISFFQKKNRVGTTGCRAEHSVGSV